MSGDAAVRAVAAARADLAAAGLRGSFLVRDLDTGREVAIDPDVVVPAASLVKLPLALVVAEQIARGELDPARAVVLAPGRPDVVGPTGTSAFRHRATIAVEDLLTLAVTISDNHAADALVDVVPLARVAERIAELGLGGLTLRHGLRVLADTPLERLDPRDAHLAYALASRAGSAGAGHPLWQLDTSRANTVTAGALADLLTHLWRPTLVHPDAAERVRALMARNLIRHRLFPDLAADDAAWSSKTGTLLSFRHEAGVLEHGGRTLAVVALSESRVPARHQPGAEAVLGSVARRLVEVA